MDDIVDKISANVSYLSNIRLLSAKFFKTDTLDLINQTVDPRLWNMPGMASNVLNAQYNPIQNAIFIPAVYFN
jgi:predicted metalloendopeptidase